MRPFEGIRVLDLTHVLAGPFTTHQLAVLGADVIKVEAPDNPDMTRIEGVVPALNDDRIGTYFMAQNGGKRAITLDLKAPEGQRVFRRLVEGADVLVQNYAGEAVQRLGLGYETIAAINPRIVYCSVSGFGRSGPKAGHAAYDVVIQAFAGVMAANGGAGSPPVRVGPPMVDYGTGAQAALAISAALFQRQRIGTGQYIDVSMMDAALMMMSAFVTDTLITGDAPAPHGNAHSRYAGYATYETAEGTIMIGAWTNRQLARLMEAIGQPARAAEVLATPRAEIGSSRDKDRELIAAAMLERTAEDWEEALNAAHVPAARVRRLDEALAHPQVAARAVVQACDARSAAGGPARLPVAAYSFAHGSPRLDRPPPGLGEHTEEVLGEAGFSAAEIAQLRRQGVV